MNEAGLRRGPVLLAVAVWAALMGVAGASVYMSLTLPASTPAAVRPQWRSGDMQFYAVIIATATTAAFLIARLPKNRIAWLLLATGGALTLAGFTRFYRLVAVYGPPPPAWVWIPIAFIGNALWAAFLALMAIYLPLFFPNGRLVSRRWRWVGWGALLATGSLVVSNIIDPDSLNIVAAGAGDATLARIHNPLGIASAHGIAARVQGPAGILFLGCIAGAVASLVVRYRRAATDQRHQLKWFIAAVGFMAVTTVVALASHTNSLLVGVAFALAYTLVPVSITIAVLRYRLYDIDVVINRALVYGALAVFITAVYVGIVVGVGSLLGSAGAHNLVLSLFATAVVAVGFQPLRQRLQQLANRLVYGRRSTPYEVLADFGLQVSRDYPAEEVLTRVAKVLGEGTAAERAEVWLGDGHHLRLAASWPADAEAPEKQAIEWNAGSPLPGSHHTAPVRRDEQVLGALAVTKARGQSLTSTEERLMDDLAHHVGLVLKNVGLTAELVQRLEELRASRQRLVTVQDEERRRLERNLHDGAQQNLVALKVKVGLIRVLLDRNPEKARSLVEELGGDADAALEQLRELARGIYPPVLADRGLVAALESHGRRAIVPVEVRGDGLRRHSQQVEAAVYFCCLEALQNVQKYAQATQIVVSLGEARGALEFEVRDDGVGFDDRTLRRGSGLRNMADRIEALGGRLQVTSRPGQGTHVRGSIPVEQAPAHQTSGARATVRPAVGVR